MNNDLISREALRDEYFKKCNRECCTCVERDDESGDCGLIRYAPAVDAEPVRHGRWIEREDYIGEVYYSCSACSEDRYILDGTPAENHMFFCPACGARMDGGADDV